jgi:hypothetical protein
MIMTIVALLLRPAVVAVLLSHVASWRLMSETVPAVIVIADGQTHPPINMDTLPIVEASDTEWFASHPDIAWAEIKT